MTPIRFLFCTLLLTATAFAQITYTKVSHSPFAVSAVTGDFDRDGRPDIASLSFAANGDALLTIYRGISGGIAQKVQYDIPTAQDANKIYTADLNNDGRLDLVIGKDFTPELEIWYGNGDATFTFGQVLNVNKPAQYVGLGDVNGDGVIDIVTGEQDDTHSGSYVFLNNGSGTFTMNGFVEAPRFMFNFALADLNGDGKLDILFRTIDQFAMFTGKGDGTFTAGPTTSFTTGAGSMIIGSFNKDSALDVAYRVQKCSTCATDSIYIFLNDGAGHLSLKTTVHAGYTQSAFPGFAAGDLNNDGVMDLVLSNNGGTSNTQDNALSYLLSHGDGTFAAPVKITSLKGAGPTPVLRHFSRDSQMDIIVPSSTLLVLFANNAPTNCTPPSSGSFGTHICTPSNGATVTKTFTVKAAGDSPAGVARMDLWIDGKKVYEVWGDQLKRTVTVAAGTHRLVVQSFDKYAGGAKQVFSVTAK